MLKISDILKKTKKKSKVSPSHSEVDLTAAAEKSKEADEESIKPNLQDKKPLPTEYPQARELASPSTEEDLSLYTSDDQEAIDNYNQAIALSKQLLMSFSENGAVLLEDIKKIIEKFIEIIIRDESTFLRLFFSDYSTDKGYLYQHSVNVCILTLYIAKFLNYNHAKLSKLGLAAFVHDIGLSQYDDLIKQPKRLTQGEYSEVKKHPITGKNILGKISQNIDLDILDAIVQEHERIDGKGYPYALVGEKEICEFAKLIGLADNYEAMMHSRPYRNKIKCTDTIKQIIDDKNSFDSNFVKALINLVGVFPVTTLIRLNTKEVGMVLKQSYQMPLRPVVNITHNAQGQKLDNPKCVNLAVNFSIYIQECFMEHNQKSG